MNSTAGAEPTLCPRCDQGLVARYRIRATAEAVHVCDECEATSFDSDIDLSAFTQLTLLLKERGLSPLWNEIQEMDHGAR